MCASFFKKKKILSTLVLTNKNKSILLMLTSAILSAVKLWWLFHAFGRYVPPPPRNPAELKGLLACLPACLRCLPAAEARPCLAPADISTFSSRIFQPRFSQLHHQLQLVSLKRLVLRPIIRLHRLYHTATSISASQSTRLSQWQRQSPHRRRSG